MEKMYLIKCSTGCYDDYRSHSIFVTSVKSRATKYVTRFNKTKKKWVKYYSQFEERKNGMTWIKDEFAEQHFERWIWLREINECWFEEIEIR